MVVIYLMLLCLVQSIWYSWYSSGTVAGTVKTVDISSFGTVGTVFWIYTTYAREHIYLFLPGLFILSQCQRGHIYISSYYAVYPDFLYQLYQTLMAQGFSLYQRLYHGLFFGGQLYHEPMLFRQNVRV